MEQDDLPPPQTPPEEPTLAGSLGEVAGSLVWIVALFAAAGVAVWLTLGHSH